MTPPTAKQIQRLAKLFSILGDPVRLRILQSLRPDPLRVSDIHLSCGLKQANTSKHLKVLREAKIVSAKREGTSVLYRIADPIVLQLCDLVCRNKEKN